MNLGLGYPACPETHREPRRVPQTPSSNPCPNNRSARRNSQPAHPACPPTGRKPRGVAFSRPSTHSILPFLPLMHTPSANTQNPPLCFQQLAHSFALRGEGSAFSLLRYLMTSLSLSPSESTLPDKLHVLPCFGRTRPPSTPLESALPGSQSVRSSESALAKNRGEGSGGVSNQLLSFLIPSAGAPPFPNRSTAAWYSLARN
jgi:hypothetical protein